MRPGEACPRNVVATLLWAGVSHERARQNLRQTLFTVRQALPGLLMDGGLTIDRAHVEVAPLRMPASGRWLPTGAGVPPRPLAAWAGLVAG